MSILIFVSVLNDLIITTDIRFLGIVFVRIGFENGTSPRV